MRKREYARLVELTKLCGPEAILRAASLCDGHSILKPDALVAAGLPVDVVEHLTTTYRSDGSPKGTIFVGGRAVRRLTGVYGLDALRFLAAALDVEYRDAIGRGFEAKNIRAALHAHFNPAGAPPAA